MTTSPSRLSLVLLLGAAVLGGLGVLVAYGVSSEYGDTGATRTDLAVSAVVSWAPLLVVAAGLVLGAALRSRGSVAVRVSGAAVVATLLVGLPAAQVLGVEAKFDRYPSTPRCADGFTSGPAVPVVQAAQEAFEELDHPGPFSGGGSTGLDGCESELMLRHGQSPVAAYRSALAAAGWTVVTGTEALLRAERDGLAFELTRTEDGGWWVWIGPVGIAPQDLDDGEVGPRA